MPWCCAASETTPLPQGSTTVVIPYELVLPELTVHPICKDKVQLPLNRDFFDAIMFFDGGCSPNPGFGGAAAVVYESADWTKYTAFYTREQATTNNKMEARAGLACLRCIEAMAEGSWAHVPVSTSVSVLLALSRMIWMWSMGSAESWESALRGGIGSPSGGVMGTIAMPRSLTTRMEHFTLLPLCVCG